MADTKLDHTLKTFLADSYILLLKTQNYHWNVTGIHFHALHAMFEEQYTDLFAAVDEIAERIRAIGTEAPGTFKQFQSLSSIDSEEIETDSKKMLSSLLGDHQRVVSTAKKVVKEAEGKNDDATMDLAIKRLNVHDKHIWMLQSSLE